MRSRLRQLADDLSGAFWLLPGATVLAGLTASEGFVEIKRAG